MRYQPEDRNLTLSASLFALRQHKGLTRDLDPAESPICGRACQVQQGRRSTRGLELEARAQLGKHVNLNASYAYTHARITHSNLPGEAGSAVPDVPRHQAALAGLAHRPRPAGRADAVQRRAPHRPARLARAARPAPPRPHPAGRRAGLRPGPGPRRARGLPLRAQREKPGQPRPRGQLLRPHRLLLGPGPQRPGQPALPVVSGRLGNKCASPRRGQAKTAIRLGHAEAH
ncbi:TonB-dependent receptor domain-containing protein [Vandammella animalimorsus]|uniref:TonB-dependent receptor domain-containing protein n=1 Tax=Vandammella animalimorsus TaxID=2029117 RepID=UPI003B9697B0